MNPSDRPDLMRTEAENLLRPALLELLCSVQSLESRWAVANPAERGRMWERMQKASKEASRVYNAVPDPDPSRCATTWFDQLDCVWDRCGLPPRHQGEHVAGYMVKAKESGGEVADAEGD